MKHIYNAFLFLPHLSGFFGLLLFIRCAWCLFFRLWQWHSQFYWSLYRPWVFTGVHQFFLCADYHFSFVIHVDTFFTIHLDMIILMETGLHTG